MVSSIPVSQVPSAYFQHISFTTYSSNKAQEQAQKGTIALGPLSPKLNRFDMYIQDYMFSQKSFTGAYHLFAMQLASGQRVYGHVRRYYPHHLQTNGRIDVGRRGVRALVLLTRAAGGEDVYHALLKTVEALSSQRYSLDKSLQTQSRPQQHFLHEVHNEHTRLSRAYAASNEKAMTFQALAITIKQMEVGNPTFQHVDYSSYLLPQSLLLPHEATEITSAPILPLLRCLGVSHTLRLFSALMCERRIVLVSQSTSRLSACTSAATSMLVQGLLHWQHIYIPILPPSMMNYLAAPMPYLIGVTANHASKIEKVQGLGEVLVVYLDENELQIHNIQRPDLMIPDILDRVEVDDPYQQQQMSSIADILKLDLVNVLRSDRRIIQGDSAGTGAAVVKEKGKDLLKRGFGKLKKVAKKQIEKSRNQNMPAGSAHGSAGPDPPAAVDEYEDDDEALQIYGYGEGFNNKVAEDEAKIAFAAFFLCLIGDMKLYLKPQNSGPPAFDKELFLHSREKLGDRKNGPLYAMLVHFKESQIFEMFVKARVAEIQARKQPAINAPYFSRSLTHHIARRVPFSGPEVRNILRQLSDSNPEKNFVQASTTIRKKVMALTSNNRPEHLARAELSKIAQDCRECGSILTEVMSVVWERIRDSKGMQWKHGYFALQLIYELILHGPIAAITEATDGLDKIRTLKFYSHMRSGVAQDMRALATSLYSLLVDRTKLFHMRRVCALRRMESNSSQRKPKANTNLRVRMRFHMMHALLKPGVSAVSPAPIVEDLLGSQPPQNVANPATSNPAAPKPRENNYGNDLLSMAFAGPSPATVVDVSKSFDHMNLSNVQSNVQPQPTLAQIPSNTTGSYVPQQQMYSQAPAQANPSQYNYPQQNQQHSLPNQYQQQGATQQSAPSQPTKKPNMQFDPFA